MMRRQLVTVIALLWSAACVAGNPLVGVRLDWDQYHADWRIGADDYDTRLSRVLLILDERVGPQLYGGLRAGYVDVSQTGSTATAGLDMYGESLGLRFGGDLVRSNRLTLYLQLDHDYLRTRDQTDDQKTELDWTQSNLELGAVVTFDRIRLTAAAYRYRVDGDQKQRGPVNNTLRVEQTDDTGVSAGVELQVDPTGYIGVRMEEGARDGARLTFSRHF